MAITSLILGMTSFILCLIPVVGVVAIIPIIISIILGIVSLVKMSKNKENKESRAPSIVGIVLSTVGLVIMIAWLGLVYFGISFFNNYEDDFTKLLKDGMGTSSSEENSEENIENEEINAYKESIIENMIK